MRAMMFVAAAALVAAQPASGAIFESQLHTGSAGGAPFPDLLSWQDVDTMATGSRTSEFGTTTLGWAVGILDPEGIRLQADGFTRAVASSDITLTNLMTVTLTEQAGFSLAGTMAASNGAASVHISGPGILGVPTESGGSLLLSGNLGAIALSGLLLPGEYTISVLGVAVSGGPGSPGIFGIDLNLTIPAPAASVPILGALVLASRRRRGA